MGKFISVLITTHNRPVSLRRTLQSLFCPTALEVPDWEVIVVREAGCDPASEQTCDEFTGRFPDRFRYLVHEGRGKSAKMNAALKAARGDVLAMTDDDVLVEVDYVPSIRTVFENWPADAAQGRIVLDCEGGAPEWFDKYFATFMGERDRGEEVRPWTGNLSGANMVVRAEAVRKVGGFDPELGAGAVGLLEDSEFSSRLRGAGCTLIYAPQIRVRHHLPRERLSKPYVRERFFQIGRSQAYLDPLPAPLWRFAFYVFRLALRKEAEAAWHRWNRRPGLALRCQCEARTQMGFLWQHLRAPRGHAPG